MVIGLLAVAAIPTVIGVGEAVSAQKKQNAANKEQEKFHIEPEREEVRRTVGYSTLCVLQGGKVRKTASEFRSGEGVYSLTPLLALVVCSALDT